MKLTEHQRKILAIMATGEWWIPTSFQHPLVYVHYASASSWARPKLAALEKRGLIERRQPFDPRDICYRITAAGRDAIK